MHFMNPCVVTIAMSDIDAILAVAARMAGSSSKTPLERAKFLADEWNKTDGGDGDGYDCKVCRNKAAVARVVDKGDGRYERIFEDCACAPIRKAIRHMKDSGLQHIIRDCTFDRFVEDDPWQAALKVAAMDYAKSPRGWFFIGGQSGAGKTHICTAICRALLLKGRKVVYMLWRDEIVRIKEVASAGSEVSAILDRYKNADVLYIDDLFKTGRSFDAQMQRPTVADINYAFEIINYRGLNPELLTIISSELTTHELLDIDEAVGGRIIEHSTAINISRGRDRNFRVRGAVTL